MSSTERWHIAILLGSLALSVTSGYASTWLTSGVTAFYIHAPTSLGLAFASLTSLSFSVAELWRLEERRRRKQKPRPYQLFPRATAILVTRVTGSLASAYLFALPILCPFENDLARVFLRVPTFFYGCKLLDLTLVRAHKPPLLRSGQDKVLYGLTDWKAHAKYVCKAFAELRYASFDIAVDESRRRRQSGAASSRVWTYGPLLLLPLTAVIFPGSAELLVLSGLLGLQLGLEALHALLHPRCPDWLFWQPFAAGSITEFWGLHWHKAANTFLHSLGYVPAKSVFGSVFGKDVGRAVGVLSAFSLSGVWHAWSGAPLSKDEHVWGVSVGLWAVFVLQGVGILVEGWLLKNEKWRAGRRRQILRVLAWMYSVETASVWLRYALPRGKII